MTCIDKIEPAAPRAAAAVTRAALAVPRHPHAAELAETLKLAVPLALTQLGQIAMMTTDLAFIGRLGSGLGTARSQGRQGCLSKCDLAAISFRCPEQSERENQDHQGQGETRAEARLGLGPGHWLSTSLSTRL